VTVVIFAEKADIPVDAVVRELAARNVPVFRADTSWFPRLLTLEALLGSDGTWTGVLATKHRAVNLGDIRSIWSRHPGAFSFAEGMTDVERAYAHREAPLGLGGVLASLDVLWVNHPNRSADSAYKPLQLAATLADLSGVDATATQLQHWVSKVHEARVICVGEQMFTIVIRAGSAVSRVDWRRDYPSLSYEWVSTPPEIEKRLRDYMATMGLTYAAVDFAIDADQRWVFLESNSAGQYFWLETNTGAPITHALCDVLAAGTHR
jgi:hypothetical protein